MYSARRAQLFCVYLMMMVSLNMCLTSNVGRQDVEVIRDKDGDFFTNPDDKCNVNSCGVYNSTTVGGYCISSDECCSQCRCYTDNPTYVIHEKQCMSWERFQKAQKLDEIHYLMGRSGKSCTEACNDHGGVCLSEGHGFSDPDTVLSIFNSLNVSCKRGSYDTDHYHFKDNPAYGIARLWSGRCLGFINVHKTINCTKGGNVEIRRLCPCKGNNDCRHWLIENNLALRCSSSRSKIPLIDLRTKDSITLKICGLSVSERQHLSNCVIQQFKYLQESHWVTFGDKEKNLFEVTTAQEANEDIILKWNKLGNHYSGVIGYSKIKCDLKEGPAMLCFVFKSNGSRRAVYVPTSQPLVTTDAKQEWSTPTKFVILSSPSSTTRPSGEGGFEKRKGTNKNTTAITAAVATSAGVLFLICVIIVVAFYRRRQKREKQSAGEVGPSNPTYGQGPENTLLLHAKDSAVAEKGEETKELSESLDNTYEVPVDTTIDKMQRSGYPAARVGNSNTYETIDPAAKSTYYYAKDVVNQIPKPQVGSNVPKESQNPDKDHVYNVPRDPLKHTNNNVKTSQNPNEKHVYNVPSDPLKRTSNNVDKQSENPNEDHVYNVLAQQGSPPISAGNEEEESLHYNVLEREPITDKGYKRKDDEHVYNYAN